MKCPDPPIISPGSRNLHYLHHCPDLPTDMSVARIDLARGLSCEDIEETSRPRMSGAELSRQDDRGDPARHVYSVYPPARE